MKNNFQYSILGNPNSGKTAVFNLLTGLNQKVSNYPGITVEKKESIISINKKNITLTDYPGSYSVKSQSIDESVVREAFLSWINNNKSRPDGIIYVADITNLRRNLYFFSQLLPLDLPIILLLNMSDIVEPSKIVDIQTLKDEFNIFDIIPFSASKKKGLNLLKNSIDKLTDRSSLNLNNNSLKLSDSNEKLLKPIINLVKKNINASKKIIEDLSLSILSCKNFCENLFFDQSIKTKLIQKRKKILSNIDQSMSSTINTLESDLRYGFIDEILYSSSYKS